MNIYQFFEQLCIGNGSVITAENTLMINQTATKLYSRENLSEEEINELKHVIMCCNILYNRTDMEILPIEDGFYDLLLEKYKTYDPNFQVGSAIVDFKDLKANDIHNPVNIATCPIEFFKKDDSKNEIRQDMYNHIMRVGQPIMNRYDFNKCPIEFVEDNSNISKRTHNTEHNHPNLVGTLDKTKFVLTNDAVKVGADKDDNVKILERDFFMDHIQKGIYDKNRIINVVLELKYDGISVEADCGLAVESARTRGDTGLGAAADISPILAGYTFKQAKCMIGEKPIGVKFEAIIRKSDLYRFNQLRGKNYKNCRTAIVGLFGASDAYKFRDLITLVPLALDRDNIPSITNRREEIDFLNKVFISNGEPLRHCFISGTVTEVLYMIKAFYDEAMLARDYLDFMYDGIVVSYTDQDIIDKLGRKNYINKYSIAVKFDPLCKQTICRGYTYTVGQDGSITPMIHYDPIEFLGTIHDKSTGSSYARFQELGLKYGEVINVTYNNDVMPYVSKCDCDSNRKNPNPKIEFTKTCPICNSNLILSDSGKSIYCVNPECPARTTQRMVNMFAKMNIKGFAEESIRAIQKDFLYQVLNMSLDECINALKDANGTKLYHAICTLKQEPIKDYIIIGSLGFNGIAHKKWLSILRFITIKDLYTMYKSSNTPQEFLALLIAKVPNIGDVTSRTIVNEFPYFEKDIESIINNCHIIDSIGSQIGSKAQIRFTGCRNLQLSERLNNAGYDADGNGSVSKKTDILIVPYESFSSNKLKKIRPDCKVVPIDEFINHMELYIGEQV